MNKPKLLVIDDDGAYLELLSEALETKFDTVCTTSLSSADEIIKNNPIFDIALVDEHIGDELGSKWIHQHVVSNTGAQSFVLYSGAATEEAIIKGLECGADDFLSKPISLLTLSNKLDKLIRYQDTIHNFESEIHSKERVINVSMAQASKYGSCMHLTSRLNQCFTLEKIRDEVFSYLYNMNLQGCIGFYPIQEKPVFYSSKHGYCSPVEKDVMRILKDKPRLYRFGNRTIFNHQLVSILILKLKDGEIDTDIYIDALASVIECIGARIAFITYQNSLIKVQSQIEQAVTATKKMLHVSKGHQQGVMNEIVQNIGTSFHILDMTLEQEEYLTNLVHSALKRHSQDDIHFLEVTKLLDDALANVDELKALNQNQHIEVSDDIEGEDELF